jgi:hypothetical protein
MVLIMILNKRSEKILKKNGLLCPLVVDKDLQLHSGNHRFKAIRKHGDASFFLQSAIG